MADPVDVLIIGAGASGGAVAWSLAETRMRIVVLEQGDWPKSSEFPSTGRDWEHRQLNDFNFSPNRRARETDYPINEDNSPIKIANFNGVGGGTVLYAGHYPRFHPSDFRVKSLDGVGDDWPITYEDLAPYYAENDRMTGVSGLAGDPAYPPKTPMMPPLPLGRGGAALGKGLNRLGWHWWPSDSAIATTDYEGRAKCINLGHCTGGCSQGAKASSDITYLPVAMRSGVEVRTRARVRDITVGPDGMASGVVYFDADGKEVFQPAHMVIVACNGVGTPRMLLNSVSGKFPRGIANSSGLVGKNLMFHPYCQVYGYFDQEMDAHRGPPDCIWSQQFYETDLSRGFKRGYTFEFTRSQGPVQAAITGLENGRIPWGEAHHDAYRGVFGHRLGMVGICEDLPEEHNTVTLDPVLKDSNGIPAPKIDYTLSENSLRMLDHAVNRGKEILKAAGAHDVGHISPLTHGGWHLMGTARMGADPERSVVNAWGRSHDVKNLFVVDGSIFVTSAGVNPTCTIQALALYVADNIKKRIANLFD